MLDCFEDTLANVRLPEAWLELDSNFVTGIELKNNWVESNKKQLSLINSIFFVSNRIKNN